jgi:hypothetical protein
MIRLLHQCSLSLFIAGPLLGLFFHPEDGISTFPWNVGGLLLNSFNNGIYFGGVYKSFQLHTRTFTCSKYFCRCMLNAFAYLVFTLLFIVCLSASLSTQQLFSPLTFNAVSLCDPSVSGCLYIGSKLVPLYSASFPTFSYSLLAFQS